MNANVMSDRLEATFADKKSLSVRQTRRGWLMELCGCEAKDEFKWFDTTDEANTQIATSLEDSNCFCRLCLCGCHEFTMDVKDLNTSDVIMSMHRPFGCLVSPCKCCCFNTMTMSANGRKIGSIEEEFYCCVPRMMVKDGEGRNIYKLHQPTCCGGICVDCCAEGKNCMAVCCKVPFHIFPASQADTDNGAANVGKILKVPKSLMTEFFTDAEAFDVTFPEDASVEQKAVLAGSAVYLNANFFESEKDQGSAAGDGIGGLINLFAG